MTVPAIEEVKCTYLRHIEVGRNDVTVVNSMYWGLLR